MGGPVSKVSKVVDECFSYTQTYLMEHVTAAVNERKRVESEHIEPVMENLIP